MQPRTVKDPSRRVLLVVTDLYRAGMIGNTSSIPPRYPSEITRQKTVAAWNSDFDNVYRVSINHKSGCVEVVCLGIYSVDSEAEGEYSDVTSLPLWIQEKLAVLSMIEVKPPQHKIEGVGIRIDKNTFWVIRG